MQMIVVYTTGITYIRSGSPTQVGGTGTYTPWHIVYSSKNIIGTVSQTSGVPTGSIIESGSNANGEYVRLADGTQICTRTVLANATTAAGSYVTSLGATAAAFVGVPTRSAFGSFNVSAGQTGNNIFGSIQMFGDVVVLINTGREAQLLVPSFTTLGTTGALSYRMYETATGRWF